MDSNHVKDQILSDAIQTAIEAEKRCKTMELVICAMTGIVMALLIMLLI